MKTAITFGVYLKTRAFCEMKSPLAGIILALNSSFWEKVIRIFLPETKGWEDGNGSDESGFPQQKRPSAHEVLIESNQKALQDHLISAFVYQNRIYDIVIKCNSTQRRTGNFFTPSEAT